MMAMRGAILLTLVLGGASLPCARVADAAPQADAVAHRSEHALPSSNGRAAIAFDATTSRITQFLEHPYRYPSAGMETRNFVFDSFTGARVGTSAAWLTSVAPTLIEYLEGTNIIHVVRSYAGVTFDEYDFAPMSLGENASFMLLEATRTQGAGAIDAYALFNYHLGSGGPLPGNDAEQILYDGTRDAYYEWGPANVTFGYASLGTSSHHGATPQNPFNSLTSGANLADNAGTAGPTTDAVAGLQLTLGDLAVGASAWAGSFTVLASDMQAGPAVDRVRAWVNGRTSDKILGDEMASWNAWITPPPATASALEATLARDSQVVLRTAQVAEMGAPRGQILASLSPGKWNIAWVRDMAYATVALARSGHVAEAKAAIAFQMGATTGSYQTYVGSPYQISVVRYFGNGTEESDSNADGPNIELDGFGLFLWELDEYVKASGDMTSLSAWWPTVKSKVGDVLVKLQEQGGLIAPDSSIWEVHWNGKQRHFAYTSIAAANGLCSAARLADKMSDATTATAYRSGGGRARDAVLSSLRAPNGTIGQSVEGLAAGTGWLDAAVMEAINFGLIDPSRRTARATLGSIKAGLVPPTGRGFMRSDAGDWYSSQEWVFVDLRASRALSLQGDSPGSAAVFGWNVDQASENFRELSELHDRVTADYAGESPMVGFGAGAYLLALYDRGAPLVPTCDAFASEPADPVDAGADAADANGADATGAPGYDSGTSGDDGGAATPRPEAGAGDSGGGLGATPGGAGGGGCGCTVMGAAKDNAPSARFAWLGLGMVALALARRRRRR